MERKTRYSAAIDTHISCFSALHAPNGDPLQTTSAIQHFHDKLLHIKDRLKTEPGKKMGQTRHDLVSVTRNPDQWALTPFRFADVGVLEGGGGGVRRGAVVPSPLIRLCAYS